MKHGFLLIDKPNGPTSHDMVYAVRNALHEKDVGHIGTLDPAASGLLVLAVGSKALKVVELFKDLRKEYIADVLFGAVSSTYDQAGIIEEVKLKPGQSEPDLPVIRMHIEKHFVGKIQQRPPAHSAIHIDGKRAYELARDGKEVEMPERTVDIGSCEIVAFAYPHLTLKVECGSGTYIRSLAHDLGQALRCGAYLEGLRRTKVGDWRIEDSSKPEDIAWSKVVPLKDALQPMPSATLSDENMEHIRHGRSIESYIDQEVIAWHNDLPVAILVPVEAKRGFARPRKVF